MKKLRNIFLLLLIAAVSLPAVAQRTYTITGTVVDPYDGSPIEGAVVSAMPTVRLRPSFQALKEN